MTRSADSARQSAAAGPRAAVAEWRRRSPFGAFFDFRADPLKTLEEMASLGGAVRFRFLHIRQHLLTEPEQIEHVLVRGAKRYGKQTIGYRVLRNIAGHGLITSDGELWRRQRRIAQPAFRKPRIEGLAEIMVSVARERVETWEDGARLDMADEMMKLTLRIVGRTLLSKDVADDADEVGEALATVHEYLMYRVANVWAPPLAIPTARNRAFREAAATVDRVVGEIIAGRRANEEGRDRDLLDFLMGARDPDSGEAMSDHQLRDEVMTIFLAGHETTATALAWTLELLGRHPEVERRLRREIEAAVGDRAVTVADLPELPYAEWVIAEAMRLYPPAWLISRSAHADDDVAGYPVRRGDWVFLAPWVTHRRPDLWPNPERFDPDRFDPARAAELPRYAYFPFAGGQRKCIGDHFAMTEARLVLITILQRARLTPASDRPAEPEPLITLRPRGGVPMRVSRAASAAGGAA